MTNEQKLRTAGWKQVTETLTVQTRNKYYVTIPSYNGGYPNQTLSNPVDINRDGFITEYNHATFGRDTFCATAGYHVTHYDSATRRMYVRRVSASAPTGSHTFDTIMRVLNHSIGVVESPAGTYTSVPVIYDYNGGSTTKYAEDGTDYGAGTGTLAPVAYTFSSYSGAHKLVVTGATGLGATIVMNEVTLLFSSSWLINIETEYFIELTNTPLDHDEDGSYLDDISSTAAGFSASIVRPVIKEVIFTSTAYNPNTPASGSITVTYWTYPDFGVLRQYFISGNYYEAGGLASIHSSLSLPSFLTDSFVNLRSYYGMTAFEWPLGMGKQRHLMHIKTPPQPFEGAELSSLNLRGIMRNFGTRSAPTVVLRKIKNTFGSKVESDCFPKQVWSYVDLFGVAGGFLDSYLAHTTTAQGADYAGAWPDEVEDDNESHHWGGRHILTATSDDFAANSYVRTTTYIAFDEYVDGIAVEITGENTNKETSFIMHMSASGPAGISYWPVIHDMANMTGYYTILDETAVYVDPSMRPMNQDGRIIWTRIPGLQRRTKEEMFIEFTTLAHWGEMSTKPTINNIRDNMYWIKITISSEVSAPFDAVNYLRRLRFIKFGTPTAKQYFADVSTDYWKMFEGIPANNDAFEDADTYSGTTVGAPFGCYDRVPVIDMTAQEYKLNLELFTPEFDADYYIMFMGNTEGAGANNTGENIAIRSTSRSSMWCDIGISAEKAKESLELTFVPDESDKTKIQFTWKPDLTVKNFSQYNFQVSTSDSSDIWVTLESFTNLFDSTYVYAPAKTVVFGTAITGTASEDAGLGRARVTTGSAHNLTTGDILKDSGGLKYAVEVKDSTHFLVTKPYTGSILSFTYTPNDIILKFRLEVVLDAEGYREGYSPAYYSNILSIYRPGANESTPLVLGTSDPRAGRSTSFTYTSVAPDGGYYLKYTAINWRDGTESVVEHTPQSSVLVTGTAVKTFAEAIDFNTPSTKRPYVQFESTQGIRSLPAYATTDCTVESSPPIARGVLPYDTIDLGDSIDLLMDLSYTLDSDAAVASYGYYATDIGFGTTTIPKYTYTPTSVGSKILAMYAKDATPYYGSPFYYISIYGTGPYDADGHHLFCTMADNTLQGVNVGPVNQIYLYSLTPVIGVMVNPLSAAGTITFQYWNGTSYTNFIAPGTTSTPCTIDTTGGAVWAITYWTMPSDWVTNGTVQQFYMIRGLFSGSNAAFDMRIVKLTEGQNFWNLNVLSVTPALLSALSGDFYLEDISYKIMRDYVRNVLHGRGGQRPKARGFGGFDVSISANLQGEGASASGKYITGTGLSDFDRLQYWQSNDQLVQIEVDRWSDISRDQLVGYIKNLNIAPLAGTADLKKISWDFEVKHMLRYVEASQFYNLSQTDILSIEEGSGYYTVTGNSTFYIYGDGYVYIAGAAAPFNGWHIATPVGTDAFRLTDVEPMLGNYGAAGYVLTRYVTTLQSTPADINGSGSITAADFILHDKRYSITNISARVISLGFPVRNGAPPQFDMLTSYWTKVNL